MILPGSLIKDSEIENYFQLFISQDYWIIVFTSKRFSFCTMHFISETTHKSWTQIK
jgi:hypothetical protein